jgi:hypothetical protein
LTGYSGSFYAVKAGRGVNLVYLVCFVIRLVEFNQQTIDIVFAIARARTDGLKVDATPTGATDSWPAVLEQAVRLERFRQKGSMIQALMAPQNLA